MLEYSLMYSDRVDRRFGENKLELFLFLNAFTGKFLLGKAELDQWHKLPTWNLDT
jgi:hypothetical protein